MPPTCPPGQKTKKGRKVVLWQIDTGKQLKSWTLPDAEAIALAPDGKTLASGGEDRLIRLWDVASGLEGRRLEGHQASVRALAFSPDGKLLASGGLDSHLHLWELPAGKLLRSWQVEPKVQPDQGVLWLTFSPNGKVLGSSGWKQWGHIDLWEVPTAKPKHRFLGNIEPYQFAFSGDSRTVATSADNVLLQWDVDTGLERYATCRASTLGFADEGTVATASPFGQARFWESAGGKLLRTVQRDYYWTMVSPNGDLFAGRDSKGLHLLDLATGKELPAPPLDGGSVLSRDGRLLAVTGPGSGKVLVWDVVRGKTLHELVVGGQVTWSTAFSPDGKMLAVPSGKGNCAVFDLATGQMLQHLATGPFYQVEFSSDGRILASAGEEKLAFWEIATGKERFQVRARAGVYYYPVDFSPDGKSLIAGTASRSGQQRSLCLLDASTGQRLHQFKGHPGGASSFAFSKDGNRVAVSADDFTVLIWDLSGVPRQETRQAVRHGAEQLRRLWADLSDEDASRVQRSIVALLLSPVGVPAFLEGRRQELARQHPGANPERMKRLLADLDDDDFKTREQSARELIRCGKTIEKALREHLQGKISAEVRQRIGLILEELKKDTSAERQGLRWLRAVEVLERLGTAEARELLGKLAQGSDTAAEQARASLHRLDRLRTGK